MIRTCEEQRCKEGHVSMPPFFSRLDTREDFVHRTDTSCFFLNERPFKSLCFCALGGKSGTSVASH